MNENTLTPDDLLGYAVARHNLSDIKKHLDEGASINLYHKGQSNLPPLHKAAQWGHVEIVEFLLAHGADVNLRGPEGNTPLTIAAKYGKVDAGRCLLRHNADPRLNKLLSFSALHIALDNDYVEFASMLLDEHPSLLDDDLINVSKWQIEYGDSVKSAKWLLNAGISPNACNSTGKPWLQILQKFDDDVTANFIDVFVSHGVDVNQIDKSSGDTALLRSVINRNPKSAMKLLAAGADPDIPNNQKQTARAFIKARWNDKDTEGFEAMDASNKALRAIENELATIGPLRSL